ncbi:NAD(P)-binding protein [Violaceomyces palustris]|uniref:NAD(P)-binding protein n=1 Tax=Violaceomyces palustris TaxID=1673888 RepID=A0ACD0NPL4_9BASI|nr:NAD(P)-binding protein [Violaceomyces palustris]
MVFGYGWTRHFTLSQIPLLHGKHAIVTGSNSGIGLSTALHLASRGANVTLACRNLDKAEVAAQQIRDRLRSEEDAKSDRSAVGKVEVQRLDLSDAASVLDFSKRFISSHDRLDILVLNAAIVPQTLTLATNPKEELTFVTNHLSHFLLTSKLLPLLRKSSLIDGGFDSRIVVVAADVTGWIDYTHLNGGKEWLLEPERMKDEKHYSGPRAYLRTKIMNVLFAKRLARLLEMDSSRGGEGKVRVNAIHPGVVGTSIFFPSSHGSEEQVPSFLEKVGKKFMNVAEGWTHMNVQDGTLTSLYAATSEEVKEKDLNGEYFFPFGVKKKPSPICLDERIGQELWQRSLDILANSSGDPEVCQELLRLGEASSSTT